MSEPDIFDKLRYRKSGKKLRSRFSSCLKKRFLNIFSKDMAIDLGTANTLVYVRNEGILINEPSVVAMRTDRGMDPKVLAVGTEAKKMLGKAPENIAAIRPMRDGVIADFEITGLMLRHFIRKARKGMSLFKPRIVIAVPSGITPVEKRAVKEAAEQAGARNVFLVEECMAAAVGAELPITRPVCNMVVDIGGGTTEVAVISLSGIVTSRTIRIAGDKMDEAIIRYIKKKYNFIIGEATAERIKMSIGNASPDTENFESTEVKGRNLMSGVPKVITIDAGEIYEAIFQHMQEIMETVRIVLEQAPPELAGDIVDSGIVLTGGVALLKNLDKFVGAETGIPIKIADNPLTTVVLGTGKMLGDPELLRQVMISE